jgi:hypothetical protein
MWYGGKQQQEYLQKFLRRIHSLADYCHTIALLTANRQSANGQSALRLSFFCDCFLLFAKMRTFAPNIYIKDKFYNI